MAAQDSINDLQNRVNTTNWDNNSGQIDGPEIQSLLNDIISILTELLTPSITVALPDATTNTKGVVRLAEVSTPDSDTARAVTMLVLMTKIQSAIAGIGGGGSISTEQIQDVIGSTLVDTSSIDVTYDDTSNQILIAIKDPYVNNLINQTINGSSFQTTLNNLINTQISGAFTNSTNQETIRDLVQVMFVDSGTVQWTINDANNTISAEAIGSGGGGSTPNRVRTTYALGSATTINLAQASPDGGNYADYRIIEFTSTTTSRTITSVTGFTNNNIYQFRFPSAEVTFEHGTLFKTAGQLDIILQPNGYDFIEFQANGSALFQYNGDTFDVETVSPGGGGSGDMLKSTYDTDNDGIVDNSERLNSQLPSHYLDRANHTGSQDISTITGLQAGLDGKVAIVNKGTSANVTGGIADRWVDTALLRRYAAHIRHSLSNDDVFNAWASVLYLTNAEEVDTLYFHDANITDTAYRKTLSIVDPGGIDNPSTILLKVKDNTETNGWDSFIVDTTVITQTSSTDGGVTYNNYALPKNKVYTFLYTSDQKWALYVDNVSAVQNFTPGLDPPDTPSNFQSTRQGARSITLTWNAPSNYTGMKVYKSATLAGTYTEIYDGTNASFVDTGLLDGTPYYYRVSAYNANGESALSSPITVTTYLIDAIASAGDSYVEGFGLPSPTTQGFAYLLASTYGASLNQQALGGSGAYRAVFNFRSLTRNASTVIVMCGLNDIRRNGSFPSTLNKIYNCLNSLIARYYLSSGTSGAAISNTGSWFNATFPADGTDGEYGSILSGRAAFAEGAGNVKTLSNMTVVRNIVVGGLGDQSTGGAFNISINGGTAIPVNQNNQSDGVSDGIHNNVRIPMTTIIAASPGSATITVTTTSGSGLYSILDYIGTLVEPANAKRIYIYKIPYLPAGGWSQAPANGSNIAVDAANNTLATLVNFWNQTLGYPVFLVDTLNNYNESTHMQVDLIHQNATPGHTNLAANGYAAID